jgi:hypothetical protein
MAPNDELKRTVKQSITIEENDACPDICLEAERRDYENLSLNRGFSGPDSIRDDPKCNRRNSIPGGGQECSCFHVVHNGPGVQQISYLMCKGCSFPGNKAAKD